MTHLSIEIPEDIVAHLRLPPRNLKQELKKVSRLGNSAALPNKVLGNRWASYTQPNLPGYDADSSAVFSPYR